MASSENVPGPSSGKSLPGLGSYSGKDGGIGTTAGSDSWNPLVSTQSILPKSVSSPL